MQIHTWKNQKNMSFELHAKHITKETHSTDWGEEVLKDVNWVYIDKLLVDGKSYKQGAYITRKMVNGMTVLDLGNVVYNGKKLNMVVALPDNVNTQVWGEYDKIEKAKNESRIKTEKREMEEMKKKVKNGYCPKCESYCHGDCQS